MAVQLRSLSMRLKENFPHGNRQDSGFFCGARWHLWAMVYTLAVVFFSSQIFYFFIPVGNIGNPDLSFLLANFASFHLSGLVTILIIVVVLVPPGVRLRALYLDKGFSWSCIIRAFRITLVLVPSVGAINFVIVGIMKMMNWKMDEDMMMTWFLTAPLSTIILLGVGAVVVAPIAEEFMFRLVLYNAVQQFVGESFAKFFTSLLFAVSHLKPEQIIPLFILALILQNSLSKSQNILLPISIHAFFNGFMIVLVLLARYHLSSTGT